MKPAKSGKILESGIYALQNQRNCLYLIESGDGFIMIDAGSDGKQITQKLAEIEIGPSKVKYVFLTHSDSDHTAALDLFINAQIHMSEDELQMIDKTKKRSFLLGYNALPEKISPDSICLLADRQKLTLGGREIECIKAPGHTPGSMVYLLDKKYLFTGDAFGVAGNTVKIHPFTMDKKTAGISIKNLDGIIKESEMVITSHYGFFMSNELK
jgi:glyoxylase-like metal-dependent hydrolase (beta-lactamase superfamily II)